MILSERPHEVVFTKVQGILVVVVAYPIGEIGVGTQIIVKHHHLRGSTYIEQSSLLATFYTLSLPYLPFLDLCILVIENTTAETLPPHHI